MGWDHSSLQGVLYSVVMGYVVANRMLGGGVVVLSFSVVSFGRFVGLVGGSVRRAMRLQYEM